MRPTKPPTFVQSVQGVDVFIHFRYDQDLVFFFSKKKKKDLVFTFMNSYKTKSEKLSNLVVRNLKIPHYSSNFILGKKIIWTDNIYL